jgi:hypothetical protein
MNEFFENLKIKEIYVKPKMAEIKATLTMKNIFSGSTRLTNAIATAVDVKVISTTGSNSLKTCVRRIPKRLQQACNTIGMVINVAIR